MHVLEDSGASELTVAGGIACEVRLSEGESMIAAEPHVLRAVLIEDAHDAAELLAASELVSDDGRAAEYVVMHDGDAGAGQRHLVGVAALVDRRIREGVVG